MTKSYFDGRNDPSKAGFATPPEAVVASSGGDVGSMLSTDDRRLCVGSHLARQGALRR
jgi:hypothetical protein